MNESAKRPYKKRSDYWNNISKTVKPLEAIFAPNDASGLPELVGEGFYQSVASETTTTGRTTSRNNKAHKTAATNRFKNIADGLLPFHYSADYVDVKEASELCQKAYFNIPNFRSTIDLMSEFANADLYLEGGSANARKFIQAWWKRISLHNLKTQYFREYYRSGNVFMYRLDGKVKADKSKQIIEAYGATSAKTPIPIKYLMLNPTDIAHRGTLSFNQSQYCKILTPYEIARLKDPKDDHSKEMLASLPEEVQRQIKLGSGNLGSFISFPLKNENLHVVFSKKQDYEPFSIPMGYAVLDDINKKLELKKIDQAIARSIENVVLLVTMGAEPDKGGINPANIKAMQEIFKNQSVGRVLVADYTTKADFIIPDLRKVIGKEKYEVLNKDIEEGLQNVLLGESKYADTQLKLKIFMQRLEESREIFLREFMQVEIKRLCAGLGIKNVPEAKFVKTDTLNDSDLQKLVIRMMELGILTPEQGLKIINTGIFPTGEGFEEAQQEYYKQREEGFYTPLVNSINIQQAQDLQDQQEFDNELALKNQKISEQASKTAAKTTPAKPAAVKQKNSATSASPSGGRPMGTSKAEEYSAKKISEAVKIINEFELRAFREFALKYGLEELSEAKKETISQVCETIIESSPIEDWDNILQASVSDFSVLADKTPSEKVLEVGEKHQLGDLAAAILYHSTQI